MDLAPYIRELILLNECIILPEFGGFESQYSPAKYDTVHKRMLPPTKKLIFRSDYLLGGAALEEHLCKHLHLNQEQANMLVKEYVITLKQRLAENREAVISGVGRFKVGLGDNLTFTPFEEENYLAESFGLESFSLNKPEKVSKVAAVKKELKLRPRNSTLNFVIVGVVIISVLLALTVFVSSKFDLYLFNIGDSSEQSDMMVFGKTAVSDSSLMQINDSLEKSTKLKTALYYSEDEAVKQVNSSKYYYLIAGSFKTYKNAEILEKQMIAEGYLPEIIDNNGYFRVAISNFNQKQEALKELQRLRRQIDRSVWLLTVNASIQ